VAIRRVDLARTSPYPNLAGIGDGNCQDQGLGSRPRQSAKSFDIIQRRKAGGTGFRAGGPWQTNAMPEVRNTFWSKPII